MSKYKATVGRPKKYNFEDWNVDEPVRFHESSLWEKVRLAAYQYGRRTGTKFSAIKDRINGGGIVVRIK